MSAADESSDESFDESSNTPGKVPDDSLVGDLESLRALLEEDQPDSTTSQLPESETNEEPELEADAEPEAEPDAAGNDLELDAQVPVLDDMIQGTLDIDEDPLEQRELVRPGGSAVSLGDDTINALLGDEWRESADRILSAARSAIENVASKWSPQQTTELNQALRVRIDATLEDWLEKVIQQRLDDLRTTLLDAIDAEIAQFIAQLDEQDSDAE